MAYNYRTRYCSPLHRQHRKIGYIQTHFILEETNTTKKPKIKLKLIILFDVAEVMSSELISELKDLLIDGLHLEDVEPDEIGLDEPLFGEGLGLDSIDALEIAVLLDRKYGVRITSGDDKNPEIFASLNSLVNFVAENRSK